MIQIGDNVYAFDDPAVIGAIVGGLLVCLVLLLLFMTLRRAGRSTDAVGQVAQQVTLLSQNMTALGQGQQQLAGNIQTVSDAQTQAQVRVIQTMETRMAEVQA